MRVPDATSRAALPNARPRFHAARSCRFDIPTVLGEKRANRSGSHAARRIFTKSEEHHVGSPALRISGKLIYDATLVCSADRHLVSFFALRKMRFLRRTDFTELRLLA